jgi:hypothetical protein
VGLGMSILLSGDWHFSDKDRDSYRWDFVETLHNLIKERKVHQLCVLGDICENKEGHNARFINKVTNVFYGLSQLCMVTILNGNHDCLTPNEPFFEFLKYIHNIDYIKVPTIKPIGLFLPWTPQWERDWNRGKIFKGHKRAFCHQLFKGASFGFGRISEEGVPIDIIPKDTEVFSCDVHARQTIGKVTYIGAPYIIDFGDDYNPRVILLEDNGKRVSIPIKGRQKRLIEIPYPTETIIEGFAYGHEVNKGDIVKIRVAMDDASKLPEFKQRVYEWGEKNGITIDTIQAIRTVEFDRERKPVAKAWHKRQDKELVQNHAKREKLDEKTTNIGLEFIK